MGVSKKILPADKDDRAFEARRDSGKERCRAYKYFLEGLEREDRAMRMTGHEVSGGSMTVAARWKRPTESYGGGVFRSSPLKPSILLVGIAMLALAGCGGGGSGPKNATAPLSPVSSASVTISPNDDDEFIDICDTYVCDEDTYQPIAEARSPIGAPIIYSTTGGPLPDTERTGQVQVGANVTPLPDWKRPHRWSDPINGVSVSFGRTWEGARAPRIVEYVIPHIDDKWEPQGYPNEPTSDTPGLAPFPNRPVLRVARGTSDEHTAFVLHAAALINSALPHNRRILIGPAAPPLVSVDTIPDGEIFVDFAAKSDWIPSSAADALSSNSYSWERVGEPGRRKIIGTRASHVWIDPSAFHTQVEFVRVLAHELLHSLGLRGHAFVAEFPESALRNTSPGILPTDNHVPEIDADGLLAIYTRLPPGTEPETLSAASLAPWENESLRMHGELNNPAGAAFGVAFRNDLARPWARGPEPLAPIAENQNLDGSVTWNGALLGFTSAGRSVTGDAKIAIDLASLTGRADFIGLLQGSSPKWRDANIWSMWGDGDLGYTLAVQGNVFRETGGDDGILTGIFVGSQHEGAVGTLQRNDLSAAFGATRSDPAGTPNDLGPTSRIVQLPAGHDLSSWLADNPGDSATVPAGGHWDVGGVRFSCSATGADCEVTLATDNGAPVISSTGGEVNTALVSPNWLMPGPGPVLPDSPLDLAARNRLISYRTGFGWNFGTEENGFWGGTVSVGHNQNDSEWEWGWWNEINLSRHIVKVQRRPAPGTYASYHDDVTVWGILDNGLFFIGKNDNGFGAGYSYNNSWIGDWEEYPKVFFENARWTGDALGMEKASGKAVSGPAVLTISDLDSGAGFRPDAITFTLGVAFKNIGVDPVRLTKRKTWFNGSFSDDGPRDPELSDEEYRWQLQLLGSRAEEAIGIFETHRYYGSYGLKK